MSVDINWLQSRRTLLLNCEGEVSPDELIGAMEQLQEALEASTNTIDFVIDWSHVASYPNFREIVPAFSAVLQQPNMGYSAFIGVNEFLAYWIEIFSNRANLRYLKFDNVDEAQTFLQKMRTAA